MTSTPFTSGASGTDEHPEVAEISALGEGLLPVERQSDVRAHLDTCGLCSDVRTSLEDIRDALGTLPGPSRMPEDVAGRIDAALAAEALLDATCTDGTGTDGTRTDGTRTDGTRTDGTRTDATRQDGDAEAATPDHVASTELEPAPAPVSMPLPDLVPVASAAPEPVVSRETTPAPVPVGVAAPRARRRRTLMLAAAAAVAVLGASGLAFQFLSPSGDGDKVYTAKDSAPSDDTAVRHRVQSLLKKSPSIDSAPSSRAPRGGNKSPEYENGADAGPSSGSDPSSDTGPGTDTLHEDETTTTVPSCVRAGIDRTENPLAVDDSATYRGRTGYLVVLPNRGGDASRVDAYVVDPSCVGADPSGPGKVLLKRTYPRG